MNARSFSSVGWVAAIGFAVLVCYMMSAQVAGERAELLRLSQQIAQTERTLRILHTELGTRGRVNQLQHWASADFGFAAPVASQFVEGEVTLARFDQSAIPAPIDGPVQTASTPVTARQLPNVVQASAPAAAPATQLSPPPARRAAPAPAAPTLLRHASVEGPTAPPAPPAARTERKPAETRARTAAAPRLVAPTPRRAALVRAGTLRELDARATSERRVR